MPRTRRGNLGREGGAGEPHQAKDSKAIIFDEILATFRVMAERDVRERPFDMAVLLAIAEYRYDVSARHYLDGFRHLYRFTAEGRVFGACPHGAVGFGSADRGEILPIIWLTMQLVASSVSNQADEQWDE